MLFENKFKYKNLKFMDLVLVLVLAYSIILVDKNLINHFISTVK